MSKTKTKKDLPQEQSENRHGPKTEHLAPWQFQPGQSGNPGGRKKGSKSLKAYAKEMLEKMNEKEKEQFMKGLNKSTIWEMAEGRPDTRGLIGVAGDKESLADLSDFFKGVATKKK